MQRNGTGASTLRNGNILLNKGQYLATGALGWSFVDTGDADTAFTPPSFTYTFKGVTPGGMHPAVIMGDMSGPDGVVFSFQLFDWGREMSVSLGRPGGNWTTIKSDVHSTDLNGVNRRFSVTYTDNRDGPGGTITFFADGIQVGEEKPAPFKPKFSPGCFIQVNASDGNTVNSNDTDVVEKPFQPGAGIFFERELARGLVRHREAKSAYALSAFSTRTRSAARFSGML
jgi:hypothetical protein